MASPPRTAFPDSTLALLREGYRFGANRFERLHSPVFETRLLGRKVVMMRGREAAELFYDARRFRRRGAMPERVLKTLLGQGGVQALDGEAHRHRKAIFMSVMRPEGIDFLCERARRHWRAAAGNWPSREAFSLLDEAYTVFTQAAFDWAGLPLAPSESGGVSNDLRLLIESPARIGLTHWRGRLARKRADAWARRFIENIRSGTLELPAHSPARVVALHRELDGSLLPPPVAAVELLNLLRPTAAVSLFLAYGVIEMERAPDLRERLATDDVFLEFFIQEVRRFYSFFPQVAAYVKEPFTWRGVAFPRNRWVLLDLFATNRDPLLWDAPEEFRPERFRGRDIGPYDFIPQGGGDPDVHHRCPGEWIALGLLRISMRFLAGQTTFELPSSSAELRFSQLPPIPGDCLLIRQARLVEA